jgi:hypothetical protein
VTFEAAQPIAKIFASRCALAPRAFVPIFHDWIQHDRLPGVLIDVADYSHLHHGPGVMLVAHGCFYSIDQGEGRPGLCWRGCRGEAAPAEPALRRAVAGALDACALLEASHPAELGFDAGEILVGFDDRLHAPNDGPTLAAAEPALCALAGALFPAGYTLAQVGDARAPFRARLKGAPTPVADLRARLGGASPGGA